MIDYQDRGKDWSLFPFRWEIQGTSKHLRLDFSPKHVHSAALQPDFWLRRMRVVAAVCSGS